MASTTENPIQPNLIAPMKWQASFGALLGVVLLAVPVHAHPVATVTTSSWITATIVSVSTVVGLWIAAIVLSGVARRMRWVTPHRHNRVARAVQVAFGGLLLLSMMMPYLVMNHPMVAAGLVVTALSMMIFAGSRNRQLSGESN